MATKKITIEVDSGRFFAIVAKLRRETVGDRFIELILSPESFRTQIAMDAAYGIRVLDIGETSK